MREPKHIDNGGQPTDLLPYALSIREVRSVGTVISLHATLLCLQQTWIQLESFRRSHKDLPLSPTIRAYPTTSFLLWPMTAAEIQPTAMSATPRSSEAVTLHSP